MQRTSTKPACEILDISCALLPIKAKKTLLFCCYTSTGASFHVRSHNSSRICTLDGRALRVTILDWQVPLKPTECPTVQSRSLHSTDWTDTLLMSCWLLDFQTVNHGGSFRNNLSASVLHSTSTSVVKGKRQIIFWSCFNCTANLKWCL